MTLEGLHYNEILTLPLGGLHVKPAVQRGIWLPTQHLLWDQGKPRKTFDRVYRTQDPPSSQQSGIKYPSPNISPYLAVALFEKSLHVCFYKYLILGI
jgi:hypothetical protein